MQLKTDSSKSIHWATSTLLIFGVIFCLTANVLSAPPGTSQRLAFIWDNPGPQYSNLQYVLAYSTNAAAPVSNWPTLLLTNVVAIDGGAHLASTNAFPPSPEFYCALMWSNSMWKTSSFFSGTAAADPYPLPTQESGLRLSPAQ